MSDRADDSPFVEDWPVPDSRPDAADDQPPRAFGQSGDESARWRRFFLVAVGIIGVALSQGWGVRGVFGGPTGATLPGALAGLAVALAFARRDVVANALYLGGLGAVGFGAGGHMGYGALIGLTLEHDVGRAAYGYACLGLIGLLWGVFGGAAVGFGLATRRLAWWVAPLALGVAIVGGRYAQGFAQESFGLLMMPIEPGGRQRPDDWIALLVAGALILLFALALRLRPVARLALFTGAGMAAGFMLGEGFQALGNAFLKDADVDWWKTYEFTAGLGAGVGLAAGLARWRADPRSAVAVPARGAIERWGGLTLCLVAFLLQVGNTVEYHAREIPERRVNEGRDPRTVEQVRADAATQLKVFYAYAAIAAGLAVVALAAGLARRHAFDHPAYGVGAFLALLWLGPAVAIFKEHVPFPGGSSTVTQSLFLGAAALVTLLVAALFRVSEAPSGFFFGAAPERPPAPADPAEERDRA